MLSVKIIDTQLYFRAVRLSTQHNAKLLEQLKSGFIRTATWNEYNPKVTVEQQNRYQYIWINPSFEGVNRLFILSFENNCGTTSYPRY